MVSLNKQEFSVTLGNSPTKGGGGSKFLNLEQEGFEAAEVFSTIIL